MAEEEVHLEAAADDK